MNTNNDHALSPSSSSSTSAKGKKPLSDITNTFFASPPRVASPVVGNSSRNSPSPVPVVKQASPVSTDAPQEPRPSEPFQVDTYHADLCHHWRETAEVLSKLTSHLMNQDLAPEMHALYGRYYEQVRERERSLLGELSRLVVTPAPHPMQPDPNLVTIQNACSTHTAALQSAWTAHNASQQAAWISYRESQRDSWTTYSNVMSNWAPNKKVRFE